MDEANTSAKFTGGIHNFFFGYITPSVFLIIGNNRKICRLSSWGQRRVSASNQVFTSLKSLLVASIKRDVDFTLRNLLLDKGFLKWRLERQKNLQASPFFSCTASSSETMQVQIGTIRSSVLWFSKIIKMRKQHFDDQKKTRTGQHSPV